MITSAARELAELAAEEGTRRNQAHRAMLAASSNRQWYVAHNGAPSEQRALDTLRRADFEIYYPMTEEFRVVPKRELAPNQRKSDIPIKRLRPSPLFPRYIFVNFDLGRSDWRDVFTLAGVHGLLFAEEGGKTMPAPIAEREVRKWMGLERDNDHIIPGHTPVRTLYQPGEQVRIGAGPFSGHNATVDIPLTCCVSELDESAKVKLLVSLLGRACLVELPISDIEKL